MPRGELLDRFDVRLPEGRDYVGRMYRTARHNGRRIVVEDLDGDLLFDTGDCLDFATASSQVEAWLATLKR
jgi:hypothetical protein